MKLSSIFALAVLVSIVGAQPARAQERLLPSVVPGARVQFVRDGDRRRHEGTVLTRTDSVLFVREGPRDGITPAVLDSLQELAIGTPRSPAAGAEQGALVGLLVGATLTFVATAAVRLSRADERCDGCFISPTASTVIVGALGTGVLVVSGALLGASAPGFAWQPVALPSRASADRRRLRVGVRLAFR